jgi:hypothetical protein
MAKKSKLILAAKIAIVFLIVPFLIARLTGFALSRAYPLPPDPPEEPRATTIGGELRQMEKRSRIDIEQLEHVRSLTRIGVVVVGIYYLAAAGIWIILWRRKKGSIKPQQVE